MARGKDPDRLTTLLAICAAFAALAGGGGLLNLILKDPPPELPAGTRVLSGLVLDWDASADGRVVAAEIRGAHRQMGDTREHLVLVRADGSEENLGYGATLPALSPDGTWIAWLASRERGDRTGPGRVRAVAGGPLVTTPAAMPPFVFGPDSVAFFTYYDATLGLGTLSRVTFGDRFARVIADQVPPNEFASVGTAGTIAIHAPPNGDCDARLIAPSGAIATVASGLACRDRTQVLARTDYLFLLRHTDGSSRRRIGAWTPGQHETWLDASILSAEPDPDPPLRRLETAYDVSAVFLGTSAVPDVRVDRAAQSYGQPFVIHHARDVEFSSDGRWLAAVLRDDHGRESIRLDSVHAATSRILAADAEHAEIRWTSAGDLLLVWSRPTDWADPRNGIYRVAP